MWLINGAAGRVRARISELKLSTSQTEQEARDLEHARHLDADEVGRRADRARQERDAADPETTREDRDTS